MKGDSIPGEGCAPTSHHPEPAPCPSLTLTASSMVIRRRVTLSPAQCGLPYSSLMQDLLLTAWEHVEPQAQSLCAEGRESRRAAVHEALTRSWEPGLPLQQLRMLVYCICIVCVHMYASSLVYGHTHMQEYCSCTHIDVCKYVKTCASDCIVHACVCSCKCECAC